MLSNSDPINCVIHRQHFNVRWSMGKEIKTRLGWIKLFEFRGRLT